MAVNLLELIQEVISPLSDDFASAEYYGKVSVVTPYSLLDGTLIEVFVSECEDESILVSDEGMTLMCLAGMCIKPLDSEEWRSVAMRIIKSTNVNLNNSCIEVVTHASTAEVCDAIINVASAAYAIDNLGKSMHP